MSKAANLFLTAYKKYDKALIVSPFKTKMITNAIVFATADVICQKVIENPPKKFDFRRLLNITMVGGLFAAPVGHLWYCKCIPRLVRKVTSNTKFHPILSMIADQTLFSTPLVSSFLFLNEFLKDFNVKKGIDNVKEKLWTGMKANWTVWPPVQIINFSFIPIHFQVPFVNFIGLFWTIYLSYLQNNKV